MVARRLGCSTAETRQFLDGLPDDELSEQWSLFRVMPASLAAFVGEGGQPGGENGSWSVSAAQDGFQAVGVEHAQRPGFQLLGRRLAKLMFSPIREGAETQGE